MNQQEFWPSYAPPMWMRPHIKNGWMEVMPPPGFTYARVRLPREIERVLWVSTQPDGHYIRIKWLNGDETLEFLPGKG